MVKFVLKIYDYFAQHRVIMWLTMIVSVVLFTTMSLLIQFKTEITDFMPQNQDTEVLDKLKIKDKLILLFQGDDIDELTECADAFETLLWQKSDSLHIADYSGRTDLTQISATTDFIYNNIPFLLSDADYDSLENMFSVQRVDSIMAENYAQLTSPFALGVQGYITKDPLGLASSQLSKLQSFNELNKYSIHDGYLCSADNTLLFSFINPVDGSSASQLNDELIETINQCFKDLTAIYPNVHPYYYGAPAIAVYNARQIKRDLMITMNVALLIIIVLVLCAFRRKRTLALLITPVAYGVLFSLACISLLQGHISAIAIGTGSVVLGVALSYSIHFIAHAEHCKSSRQLVQELTRPLIIGSLTTIGAFVGLLFTSSPLLHDFGLFAAFALVGTMFFCLFFLPHFLVCRQDNSSVILKWFNRLSALHLDRKWWALGFVILLFVVSLFFCNDVGFDYDMMHINYMPKHIKEAEKLLNDNGFEDGSVLLVVSNNDINKAIDDYHAVNTILYDSTLSRYNLRMMSLDDYIVNDSTQLARLAKWNRFFTPQRRSELSALVDKAAIKAGFVGNSFEDFDRWINQSFQPHNMLQEIVDNGLLFSDLVECDNNGNVMCLTQLWIDNEARDDVYSQIADYVSIIDNNYYIGKFAETVNNDFNYILLMSTLLIFIVLLLSYRRFELSILAFTPMLISWVMILGVMSLLHIDFNIVNIILSTFIFGIGDDFSIFVLDGLMNDRRNGKEMFAAHKVAIFFSAISTIIGMGALLFAQHPAIYSLSIVSLVGIIVVVLLATVLLPALFRLLVADNDNYQKMPHTILNMVRTAIAYFTFCVGCILSWGLIIVLLVIPSSMKWKRKIMNMWITIVCRFSLAITFGIHYSQRLGNELFAQSSIIVANHQSFIDLLAIKSIDWKIIFVSKRYILNNPFVGPAARCAGFMLSDNSEILNKFKQRIDEGYSVLIFPEGTRSRDHEVHRFHKGAFLLAQQYQIDIVAMSVYGSDCVLSPYQVQTLNAGTIMVDVINHFTPQHEYYQLGIRSMSDTIRNIVRDRHHELSAEFGNANNLYFRELLYNKYLYKGNDVSDNVRWLLRADKWFEQLRHLTEHCQTIAVVNSGNGLIPWALKCYRPSLRCVGYELDEELLAIANHVTLDGVHFEPFDVTTIPTTDAYIINIQVLNATTAQQVTAVAMRLKEGSRLIINYTPQLSWKQRVHYLIYRERHYCDDFFNWFQQFDLKLIASDADTSIYSTIIVFEK